jgi:hypothetical protein
VVAVSFSSRANTLAIWRMATLKGSSVVVRSSPEAEHSAALDQGDDTGLLDDELTGEA